MSGKFRRSWMSQFGLYRYDDNLRKNKKECATCFYGIIATISIIIITVFVFITNTDLDPPKRIIIFSNENKTQSSQLSTASVIMQQIPTNFQIDSEISITTPLSLGVFHRQEPPEMGEPESLPQKLEFRSYPSMYSGGGHPPNHNIYPNHRYDARRQLEGIIEPRPFDYFIRGTPPTAFQRNQKNSSGFPQIPKEYEGTVNSIQDILKQVSDGENQNHDTNGVHKIKIAGTYKHRKVDDLAEMFEPAPRKNREKSIDKPVTHTAAVTASSVIRDPFYKYKPNSLSDVNLMATKQFRFAPYHILSNKFVPTSSSPTYSMDPGNLYHQIIMANANRLKYLDDNSKKDNIQSKQKPFTLMLDVYPMPDDEQHISSTVSLPVKYQNHFNSHAMRHPGISSINNLQPYVENAHYPHLKPNRYPNLPHYHNPNYFRKFGARPLRPGLYASDDRETSGNNPSQITVHLNLFPKKKERSNSQNGEIYSKNDIGVQEEGTRFQDRMVKLSVNVNQTDDQKEFPSKESTNFEKVSNKVDMEMLQISTTTVSDLNQKFIMIDEPSDTVDSSEDIFNKEFLQSPSTDSPAEHLSTTLEAKSDNGSKINLIPTILPIEPREYDPIIRSINHY